MKSFFQKSKFLYNNLNSKNPLILTDACVNRIKYINKQKGLDRKLRILVDAGGCSGFTSKFSFSEEKNSDDIIFSKDGAEVVVDTISFDFIEGATIDYKEDMMSASFRIERNPQAQSTCSCGSSFSKKE